jgi:NAD(P) transhydrogenase subunit alpha
MARIAIPKEISGGENRVALVPSMVPILTKDKHEVLVERGAGEAATFTNDQYVSAGAQLVDSAADLYAQADVILKVRPPLCQAADGKTEAELFREGSIYIGFFAPQAYTDVLKIFLQRRITSFSLEYIPRITRAQGMDALSSMSTVAGYKAVLLAAAELGKMFPLMMTAAGTVPPSSVLVLGAGVAGLQAIATAKRLGAKVEAFDPRPAVKEQVKSLGAAFVDIEVREDVETGGGYAKEQSEDFLERERKVIAARLPKVNVVISTAQVFSRRSPILLTEEMVKLLRPGSVIVDLAAAQGGNCELTVAGKTVQKHGVTIIGAVRLASTVPADASQMYSRNVLNLVRHLYPEPGVSTDYNDEIIKSCCITRDGEVVNESVRKALQGGGKAS